MKYEIVELEESTVVGLRAKTNNMSPDMGSVIGGLWESFYREGNYFSIKGKKNDKALGIYTDYENNENGDYTVMTACETDNSEDIPSGMVARKLPAGKYAKFIVTGDMHKAVAEFWQELWNMELPRSFQFDFEEYQNGDMENAEIHMYIGLK